MSLTRDQVGAIAHLARLEITEEQMPVYVDSLSRIIDFVEQLQSADTGDVEPMAHPLADQVQRGWPRVQPAVLQVQVQAIRPFGL